MKLQKIGFDDNKPPDSAENSFSDDSLDKELDEVPSFEYTSPLNIRNAISISKVAAFQVQKNRVLSKPKGMPMADPGGYPFSDSEPSICSMNRHTAIKE